MVPDSSYIPTIVPTVLLTITLEDPSTGSMVIPNLPLPKTGSASSEATNRKSTSLS